MGGIVFAWIVLKDACTKLQLPFGIPQWSVGSVLFVLYTAKLSSVTAECGFLDCAFACD